MYSITGIATDPLQSGLCVVHSLSNPIVLGPGVIELECDANNTGQTQWFLVYRPIETAASVS